MAVRLYAQRTTTGEWLHTDVAARCDWTTQLNGFGHANLAIPRSLEAARASDGKPLWMERGTTLYVEEDQQLEWVGLCSFQRPTLAGHEVEFKGLSWAFDLIEFAGRIREWEPDPFDMVERLVDHAQHYADGDMGFHVVRDGRPPTYAGDEQPPSPRPEKVKRRRGETKDHFSERQEDRQKEQDRWDKDYGDREPYSVAWWEAPYVAEEIGELAREIPFDWYETHRWSDRPNLERRSDLVLTPRKGRPKSDLRIVEGVNLAAALDPRTDVDRYGNNIIMLGAGEGSKMRRAAIGRRDGRVRTTRYGEAKHQHNHARLRAMARDKFGRMGLTVRVDEATMRGKIGDLELGDSAQIDSSLFEGWARVFGVTRNNHDGNVTLSLTASGGGE